MIISYKDWKKLFLFCLGIFIGAAFCMKWIEQDFINNGELFTIIGLEVSYTQQQISALLNSLEEPVKKILRYHLYFDFAFMCGVYPGIAALCMMACKKSTNRPVKKIVVTLALLQAFAFACDVYENCCLLKWLNNTSEVSGFAVYHFAVFTKWGLALLAAVTAATLLFLNRKK